MITQELLSYIKDQIAQGATREQIKNTLLTHDWTDLDIEEAFQNLGLQTLQNSIPERPQYTEQSTGTVIRERKNIFPKILIGLAIVVIVALGAMIYLDSQKLSPEEVFARMGTEISSIESFQYSADVEGNIISTTEENAQKNNTINVHVEGQSDNPDLKNIFDVKTDLLDNKLVDFSFEMRTFSNNNYLKPIKVPEIEDFDLSSLENQWIIFEASDIEENFDTEGVLPEFAFSNIKKQGILSNAINNQLIAVNEVFPSEMINGTQSYHYSLLIDQDTLKNISKNLEINTAEIWIGETDFLPRKIYLDVKDQENSVSTDLNIEIYFTSFNTPMNIEEPKDTKTVEQVFEEIFTSLFDFGEDDSLLGLDTDNDGLVDDLEEIFGTNPNNPDTDGDGVMDGVEVEQDTNPNGSGSLF